jgi:hypothetical protein
MRVVSVIAIDVALRERSWIDQRGLFEAMDSYSSSCLAMKNWWLDLASYENESRLRHAIYLSVTAQGVNRGLFESL